MTYKLVVKDAFWQVLGRIISALVGFFVVKLISPYLGTLRWGDYSTILKYFAIWSAFADFGLYVIALKKLGEIKKNNPDNKKELEETYGKFVAVRFFMIIVIYLFALIIAYFIPSYTNNPYILRGLPLGMMFSASFMSAGILQIPVQLYWKMQHVTFALIIARVSQIAILILSIFFLYKGVDFASGNIESISAFQFILLSVVLSGISQAIYVYFIGQKYLKLKLNFDFKFLKEVIFGNWKYGLAYYLSSFHTLVVLIIFSVVFPTIQNYNYVGIWALALTLIEILLIIPSALGNSIIHKIGGINHDDKMKSFGNLMSFIIWIGLIMLFNFAIFSSNIIYFVGKDGFLSKNGFVGSDYILPFLGIVLFLSFIKQIFNYIFVSSNLQNKLLKINLIGVFIGTAIGIPLIILYNIKGGIITQLLLEILFVIGAIIIAYKNNSLPKIQIKKTLILSFIIILIGTLGYIFIKIPTKNVILFFLVAMVFNLIILLFSYKPLKPILKNI